MTTTTDCRHGFDFWQGTWHGRNRKLVDVTDPHCTDWIEFDATCHAQSTLGGLGNIDTFHAEDMPGRGRVEGMTVRLYDPATDTWKIWWVSSTAPGDIGIPVEGRWTANRGLFHSDEELAGRPVKVQFEWTLNSPTSARWRQLFSFDAGHSWHPTWTVDHTRAD